MADPRMERRAKADPNSVKPPMGTGINTGTYAEYNAAMQQSLIPGSSDPKDHRGNPTNAASFKGANPKYGNPYADKAMDIEQVRTIDPTTVQRSGLMQGDGPGRLANSVPPSMRQPTPTGNQGDAMESARLALYAGARGLPAGGMGIEGVPAAHMDNALYTNANLRTPLATTMSVDGFNGDMTPGKTPIRKGNRKGNKKGKA